jgi:hypothetical protein
MSTDNPLSGDTPIDFTQISPKQAGEALAQMTADYHKTNPPPLTPDGATAELAKIALAPPAPAAVDGGLSPYKTQLATEWLTEIGFPPEGAKFTADGTKKYAPEVVAHARLERARALSDDAFVSKYLQKNHEANHWMHILNTIISNPSDEKW